MKINLHGARSAFMPSSENPEPDMQGELFKCSKKATKSSKKWSLRYCVLRGNLLYYSKVQMNQSFDVKDSSVKHSNHSPSGLIILECHQVDEYEEESRMFCFEITFSNRRRGTQPARSFESRTSERQKASSISESRSKISYVFASQSASDIQRWVSLIRNASSTQLIAKISQLKLDVAKMQDNRLQQAFEKRQTTRRNAPFTASGKIQSDKTAVTYEDDMPDKGNDYRDGVVQMRRQPSSTVDRKHHDTRQAQIFDNSNHGVATAPSAAPDSMQFNAKATRGSSAALAFSFDHMHIAFGKQLEATLRLSTG